MFATERDYEGNEQETNGLMTEMIIGFLFDYTSNDWFTSPPNLFPGWERTQLRICLVDDLWLIPFF